MIRQIGPTPQHFLLPDLPGRTVVDPHQTLEIYSSLLELKYQFAEAFRFEHTWKCQGMTEEKA